MSALKATPGPWVTAPYGNGRREATVQVVAASGASQVCGAANNADATLIAAAPDLYEALASFLTAAEYVNAMPGTKGQELRAKAHTALAKARGEQSDRSELLNQVQR